MITLKNLKVFNSVQDEVTKLIEDKFIKAAPHLKDMYQYSIIVTAFNLEKKIIYFLDGSSGEWESGSIAFSEVGIE